MFPGADSVGRRSIGQITDRATAITPLVTDWYQETPQLRGDRDARYRVALEASGMVRGGIFPIIPSFGYYANLSTPTTRPKLPAYEQQTLAYGTIKPVVSFGWFESLSEPKRFKPRATDFQGQPYIIVPLPGPATGILGWYVWLSEPKRFKKGFPAEEQQVLAYHPRMLPTPDVTGIMNAIETNLDEMLMSLNVIQSGPPDSAIVSIQEIFNGGSVVSVRER